jgi:hypothetical protein
MLHSQVSLSSAASPWGAQCAGSYADPYHAGTCSRRHRSMHLSATDDTARGLSLTQPTLIATHYDSHYCTSIAKIYHYYYHYYYYCYYFYYYYFYYYYYYYYYYYCYYCCYTLIYTTRNAATSITSATKYHYIT